jgi:excisionase family DNA binding protein
MKTPPPIIELAQKYPAINITMTAGDLLAAVEYCIKATHKELEQLVSDANTETYLSVDQTAKMLNVDRSTLYRWANSGYLVPLEIGGKRRYRMSDINKNLGVGQK